MYFSTREGDVHAVDDVSFTLEAGKVLGIAGESGSGKSSIALTLLRLLPSNAKILGGTVTLDGQDLRNMPESQLRKEIRWKRISLVSQAAMNALNPVFKIGDQIKEAIRSHTEISDIVATSMVKRLLEEVGISQDRYSSYPHELSGGMKQRAIIAMSLALDPEIIIADEPTTALDVIVQAQILVLLRSLQRSKGLAMILITHDLSLVAEMCDKVAILYAGQIVEYGPASKIFHDPRHPYTMGLIKAFPNLESKKQRLISIPGAPPDLINPPSACRFVTRCSFATEKCSAEAPPMEQLDSEHESRCWYAKEIHI